MGSFTCGDNIHNGWVVCLGFPGMSGFVGNDYFRCFNLFLVTGRIIFSCNNWFLCFRLHLFCCFNRLLDRWFRFNCHDWWIRGLLFFVWLKSLLHPRWSPARSCGKVAINIFNPKSSIRLQKNHNKLHTSFQNCLRKFLNVCFYSKFRRVLSTLKLS